jgi:hypothetical protein
LFYFCQDIEKREMKLRMLRTLLSLVFEERKE